jgi:hypothetical protein
MDEHCTDAENPVCVDHRCEECRTNDDCTTDKPVCGAENQCTNG